MVDEVAFGVVLSGSNIMAVRCCGERRFVLVLSHGWMRMLSGWRSRVASQWLHDVTESGGLSRCFLPGECFDVVDGVRWYYHEGFRQSRKATIELMLSHWPMLRNARMSVIVLPLNISMTAERQRLH